MTTRKSVLHWSRLVLVGTIVFMGAALLLTVWVTYRGVGNATEALVRGQAAALTADLRGEFRDVSGRPTNEDLKEILDDYSDSGLRYIAVVSRKELVAEAGSREDESEELRRTIRSLQRGQPSKTKGRVRLLLRAPGTRSPRRRRAGPNRGKGPPPIYIEFYPSEAEALNASSSRSLMVGVSVAALLLMIAVFLMRWFVRLDRLREQQEHDRRLKSLGEMSAVLAHEIRNPLASLKGNAQILEKLVAKETQDQEKNKNKAERVVSEANRLETLVNDLLDFARNGELHKRESDPGLLLQTCVDEAGSEKVVVDVGAAPKAWTLDPDRMQQVLSNLLRNATQASVKVEARAVLEADKLVFVVRDHGDGLDEAEIDSLFEPFHTKKVHGTGLGLAVAHRLVELHGGTISASNAEGGGAEFRVVIPAG